MRLLVIEDNPKMARLLAKGLSEQGYSVEVANTGRDGEDVAAAGGFDLVILDVMLPDTDGVSVCRNLRHRGVVTPIAMLTALSSTSDKIAGLDAGADDYVIKPFEFDELVARIRALLRRGQAQEASMLSFEDIEMDLHKRRVTRGGRWIKLTAKEFAVLEYLLRNPERVLTRTAIGEHVWDMNFDGESNVIDVYISLLRRKIDTGFPRRLVQTKIGVGYILSAECPES